MNEHLQPEPNEVHLGTSITKPRSTVTFMKDGKVVVTIDPHAGTVTLAPGATWDTAAVAFWDAVRRMMPSMREYDAAIAAAEARVVEECKKVCRNTIMRAQALEDEAWERRLGPETQNRRAGYKHGATECLAEIRALTTARPA